MRFATVMVVAFGMIVSTARAQTPLRADSDSIAEAEIEALEYDLIGLLQRRELDEYASYLAEDYVRVNHLGIVASKEDVLAEFASGGAAGADLSGRDPARMTPSDLKVRVYGDTAIMTFVLTIDREGQPSRRSRLVKIFVHRDGHWIMVHNQGTPLE